MGHAVDFVLDVMQNISLKSSELVLFQRDRSLYVASADGFGQVTYGLPTRTGQIPDYRKEPLPAIAESTDAFPKEASGRSKKPKFISGEQPYFQAIAFGSDTNQFTLEDMTKAAEQLAELPDDGKIRMIDHDSSYHSHKHGYAADGIDVYVQDARVMDRNRYLELVREEEDKLVRAIGQVGEVGNMDCKYNNYELLKIPDVVIVTPYLMVSLPRKGRLHLHRDEPDSWTEQTYLKSNYSGSTMGSILHHNEVELSEEFPYQVYITINARKLQEQWKEGLEYSGKHLIDKISEQLFAITSSMPIAERFLGMLNGVHNKVCFGEIEQRKNWRKKIPAGEAVQL